MTPIPASGTVYPHQGLPLNYRLQFRDATGQQSMVVNAAGEGITTTGDRISAILDTQYHLAQDRYQIAYKLGQDYAQFVKALGPSWFVGLDAETDTYDLSSAQRGRSRWTNDLGPLALIDPQQDLLGGNATQTYVYPGAKPNPVAFFNSQRWAVAGDYYQPFVNGTTRTFMGFFYPLSVNDTGCLFGSLSAGHALQLGGTQVIFYPNVGGGTVSWGVGAYATNAWNHFALVFNEAADQASWYLNGSLISTQTLATSWAANSPILLGAYPAQPFPGYMCYFSIFERGLSGTEIANAYAARLPA
jgi:hypothetical protein